MKLPNLHTKLRLYTLYNTHPKVSTCQIPLILVIEMGVTGKMRVKKQESNVLQRITLVTSFTLENDLNCSFN